MSQIIRDSGGTPGQPSIETLTGNVGGPVGPDGAFNINVIGAGNILVTGTPINNTLTITEASTSIITITPDLDSAGGAGLPVSPDVNGNFNIFAGLSSAFDLNELETVGTVATSTIVVTQFNTLVGFVSGLGPSVVNVITFNLGTDPAVYILDTRLVVFDNGAPAGAGYNLFGTIRTDGATATLVGTVDQVINEEGILVGDNATMVASGNNAIIQYTVPAGANVDITAYSHYTKQGI